MDRSRTRSRLAALAALGLTVLGSLGTAQAAEMRMGTLTQDTVVRKEGKPEGESLGQYRAGTQVRVFYPARNGWYAMYFATPVKGSNYGWMPESSIMIADPGAAANSALAAGGAMAQQARAMPGSAAQSATGSAQNRARSSQLGKYAKAGTMLGINVGPHLIGNGGGTSIGFGADLSFPGEKTVIGVALTYFKLGNVVTTRSDKAIVGDLQLLYFPSGAAAGGFYGGLKAGLFMMMYGGTETELGVEYAISGSDSKLQIAPTIGMLFGHGSTRFGIEGAYRLLLSSGSSSVISFALGAKFAI